MYPNLTAISVAVLLAAVGITSTTGAQTARPRTIPLGSQVQAGPEGYDLARPDVSATAFQPLAWHIFLVAADRSEPVFDNAVAHLAQLFQSRYGITVEQFSARPM